MRLWAIVVKGGYPLLERVNRLWLTLFMWFLSHRLMVFNDLGTSLKAASPLIWLQAFLVGAASDLWMAALIALLFLMAYSLCTSGWRRKLWAASLRWLEGAIALALAVHIVYVQFFHTPLLPLHIRYLGDRSFLAANAPSLGQAIVVLSLLLCWLLSRLAKGFTRRWVFPRLGFIALLVVATLAHGAQIRYRVQWFVPEPLQYNLLEHVFVQAKRQQIPIALSQEETETLQTSFASDHSFSTWDEFMFLHPGEASLQAQLASPLLAGFRSSLQQLAERGERPLVLVLLMESFRALDSLSFGGRSPSLTPAFDALAAQGLLFTNAWSVGTVTRSGQEAVWCGYLSSMYRSLMRERSDLDWACLPRFVSKGYSFWFHGGEGRFDNQLAFWQRQGVDELMSATDFPPSAAKSSWGVGDRTFFKAALKRLVNLHETRSEAFLFGMLLTITNHIPWQIPEDAEPTLTSFDFAHEHPSSKTIRYTDQALGEFVAGLKERQLWDKTLLVVVGDHGIEAPAQQDGREDADTAEQLAHVPLLLSGGISEGLLRSQGLVNLRREEVVSQADIAAFLAYILDLKEAAVMSEPLLTLGRKRPVFSDFGHSVYFPALGKAVPMEEALARVLDKEKDITAKTSLLYYRYVLQKVALGLVKKPVLP